MGLLNNSLHWDGRSGGFSSGHTERIFNGLLGALLAAFGGLAEEDAQQVIAALDRRHDVPAGLGQRLALEGCAQNRGRFLLAFHREKQRLGQLVGAFAAGFGGLAFVDEVREALLHRRADGVKVLAQAASTLQCAFELDWYVVVALFQVGLQRDADAVAGAGFCARLHLLVHQQDGVLAALFGKKRGAKGESVDVAAHTPAIALRPRLGNVERDPRYDPVQVVARGLEECGEGFWLGGGHDLRRIRLRLPSKLDSMEILYGVHPVEEALRAGRRRFDHVIVARERQDTRVEKLVADCRQAGVRVRQESREQLTQLAGTAAHQGVVAVVRPQESLSIEDLFEAPQSAEGERSARLVLALDGVEDPQNLGALLRVADGAGVDGVVLTQRRGDRTFADCAGGEPGAGPRRPEAAESLDHRTG